MTKAVIQYQKLQIRRRKELKYLALSFACFFFLVAYCNVFAQTTFQKAYGGTGTDEGRCVRQTSDGGYIIECSTTNFGPGSGNAYLIKTDAAGATQWAKTYGGSGSNFSFVLDVTNDGGYILTGGTTSFGAGNNDVYLVRANSGGDTLWTKTIGGTLDDYAYAVQQTTDSGFIVAGTTVSFGSGGNDMYLIKTNSNGDTLWTKAYGGTGDDVAFSALQTFDGGYILAGYTTSFGITAENIYIVKTDANGNPVWSKTYGGTGTERAFSISQSSDSSYVVTGYTTSFGSGNSMYLLKIDSIGSIYWSKTYSGGGAYGGNSVKQTADGGYVITGNVTGFGAGASDVYLVKTDATGDTLWAMTYGGTVSDIGFSVARTTDKGYIISGSTRNFGAGSSDVYLVKTDSLGRTACNGIKVSPVITSPAMQVTTPATIVSGTSSLVSLNPSLISGGGAESTLCIALGEKDFLPNNNISIFPNPANNYLSISGLKNQETANVVLNIYNSLGEKVLSLQLSDLHTNKGTVDISKLSNGIYLVKIETEDFNRAYKFIKL